MKTGTDKKKNIFKKTLFVLSIVFVCIAMFQMSTQVAYADDTIKFVTNVASEAGAKVVDKGVAVVASPVLVPLKLIGYLITVLVGILIKFAGLLIGIALYFNTELVNLNPPIIVMGWTLFRDIANLGFVFGIILVAVATILRIKQYEMKTVLWRIIVSALLVNFSLTFCLLLVKVSDIPTNYFLDNIAGQRITGNPDSITAARITESFKLTAINGSELNSVKTDPGLNFLDSLFPSISDVTSQWIRIVISFLIFLILLGLAGALLLRFFQLTFLIILSPAVCLLWAFPSTKKYFTQWWDKFLKQLLFAPATLLFVYLALKVQEYSRVYIDMANAGVLGGESAGIIGNLGIDKIVVSLIPGALLIGGMIAAKGMGYAGSGMALNAWNKGSAKTKEWAKTRAKRTGASLGNKVVGNDRIQNKLNQWGQSNNRLIKWSGAGALSGALGRAAIQGENKLNKVQQGDQEDIKKKYGNLSADDLKKILPTFRGKGQAYTAVLQMLADKDALGGALNRPEDLKNVQAAIKNLKDTGKGDVVAPLLKKLGLNEKALGHLIKYNEGGPTQATDLASFKSETDNLFSNMEADDFKAFAKNNANNLENNNFFGLPSTTVDDMRGFTDDKMISDETLISAYAPKIKDATKLKEFNTRIIEKKLKWFEDEKKARENKLTANSGAITPQQEQRERNIINVMDMELKDFKAKLATARTSGSFGDLIKAMKEKSTSSTAEMRDFAKRIRVK